MSRKRKAPREGQAQKDPRVQFDISRRALESIEAAFEKRGVRGHRAMFVAGSALFRKLAAEEGYVRVRILDGGLFEIERPLPAGLRPATLDDLARERPPKAETPP